MSNIVVMKLSTGEEVIARVEESLEGNRYVKPRIFHMMQTERGASAALIPYIMSAPDETVTIKDSAIISVVTASKQLEDAYLQQTSGIDLTAANI
jgi:hypothetical protein